MDIKQVLTLIESAEQPKQTLAEGRNMAKEMVMQHYTKQEIKTPVKQPVSRLNEYFKVVDNEMLNVVKEAHDARQVEVKKIVNRVLERLNEGKKDQSPKPRNFVAKNAMATTSGAGAHKDKKRAEKQGDVKHKKDRIPMDVAESDDWGSMSRREFKRREMEHELGHEDSPEFKRMMRERDRGPWYIKIDGKIFKQKGEPKMFDWRSGANNYALAILKNKPELEGKITLTKRLPDEIEGVSEGSDWGEPREILEDVLDTLEREVEWPLTEVMDPKEVRQLVSPIVRAVNDKLLDLDRTDSEIDIRENNQLVEKAVSKAQQRFMGMVHAAKKGEKPASKEVAKVAKGMSAKAAKDFAKTKHKGLPNKKVDESRQWEISPYTKREWVPCPDGTTINSSGERVRCGTSGPNGPNEPGYWDTFFVDKNGKRVDDISPWLKSLSQKDYDAWADEYQGAGGAVTGSASGQRQAQSQKTSTSTPTPTAPNTNKSEENKKIQMYLNKKYNAGLEVDGIVGPKTKAAIAKFMKENAINESVAGPKKCWPGHRKVGTKLGTGKNAGKRVNDCEKIKETIEVGSPVKVYSNVLKKPVYGYVVELKEGKAYVNYANTKIVMAHPLSKVELLEAAAVAPAAAGMAGRVLPGVGAALGAYDAWDRFKKGDYTGAGLSAGAGLAGLVPGVGTAAATGLIGAQLARDYKKGTGVFSKDETQQSATPATGAYTIKKGDTLTKIAKTNNTTVDAIMKANPQITDPNKIAAGAKLNLPGQSATLAAQKPTAQSATSTTNQTNTTTNTNVSGTIKMGKPEGPIQYNGKTVNPGDPEYAAASQALIQSQQRMQQARQRPQQPSTAPVQQGAVSREF